MHTDDACIGILRRMLDDAKALTAYASDPVLEGRTGFLVAYIHDIPRLKDPFGTIEHIVDWE